jgi:hypothetical protein
MTEATSFSDSLRRWEACKIQLEESRQDFLACKDFGTTTALFTSAIILSEAFCMAEEAREAYEDIADRQYMAMVRAEKEAVDAERLRAALQDELESAS